MLLLGFSYGACQTPATATPGTAQDTAVKPDAPIPGLTEDQSEFFRYSSTPTETARSAGKSTAT